MPNPSPTDAFLLTIIFDESFGSLIEEFADKVSDPTHTWYGCYMDREELETYVRPSEQALAAVDAWLKQFDIELSPSQAGNAQVRFYSATRAQIQLAFGSGASRWLDPTVETRAHRREWPVPREIAGLVQQVQVLRAGDKALAWLDGTHWLRETAMGMQADQSGQKPAGLGGLSPADIADIYEVPDRLTGLGETIAVLMLSHAPNESDVVGFWRGQGIKRAVGAVTGEPSIIVVPIGPQPDVAPGDLGALESAMVVEWAGAMAPGARIVVYVVDERTVADPWTTFLLAVIGDKRNRPTIACTTWLLPERQYYNRHGASAITGLLNQCTALGITVLSATGDWGCFDSFPRDKDSDAHTIADAPWPHAVFPAVEDKVLAVGGTMIPQREPLTEVAWSGPLPVSLYGRLAFTSMAGGGGFSMEVPVPEWQRRYLTRGTARRAYSRGPDVPAVLAYGRGIPDVALVSTTRSVMTTIPKAQQRGRPEDLTTQGYQALVQGTWIDYAGGTSLAAPVWAALIARINQARRKAMEAHKAQCVEALQTRILELATSPDISLRPSQSPFELPVVPDIHPALGRPVGFVNPLLYRFHTEDSYGADAPAFRDVVTGVTDVLVRTLQRNHDGDFKAFIRRIPGYEADRDWDPVSGLGVPRTGNLVDRMLQPVALGLEPMVPIDQWIGALMARPKGASGTP